MQIWFAQQIRRFEEGDLAPHRNTVSSHRRRPISFRGAGPRPHGQLRVALDRKRSSRRIKGRVLKKALRRDPARALAFCCFFSFFFLFSLLLGPGKKAVGGGTGM